MSLVDDSYTCHFARDMVADAEPRLTQECTRKAGFRVSFLVFRRILAKRRESATHRGRIPLLPRCFALVEHGVAAVAVCATSAAKCGLLHEHSRYDQSAQHGQNYRVSSVHFERQW